MPDNDHLSRHSSVSAAACTSGCEPTTTLLAPRLVPLAHLATLPLARLAALTPSLLVIVVDGALVPTPAASCLGSPLPSPQCHSLPGATSMMSDAAITAALTEDIAQHRLISAKRPRPRGDQAGSSSPIHLFPELINPVLDDVMAPKSGCGLNMETFREPKTGRIYMQLAEADGEAPACLTHGSIWLQLPDLLLAQLSAVQPSSAAARARLADVHSTAAGSNSSSLSTSSGAMVLRQLLALSAEAGQAAARAASRWGDPAAKEEIVRLACHADRHICESMLCNQVPPYFTRLL